MVGATVGERVRAGTGALRALRALVFLAVTMALTTAGHVLGGGTVRVAALAALVVVAWPVALLGSRRQRGVRHLFPALVTIQLVGHMLLASFGEPGTAGASTCSTTLGHHGHQVVQCGETAAAALAGSAHPPAMTLAHVLVALVLAVGLAKGEALLWRVVDLVLPAVPRAGAFATTTVVRSDFLLRCQLRGLRVPAVPGRGPPVVA